MSTTSDHTVEHQLHMADPEPTQRIDLEYPTLARLVASEASGLVDQAECVNDELADLTTDFEWESAIDLLDLEAEAPRSVDELVALLNGIGSSAYRLARHVRSLVDARSTYLAARANGHR